MKRDSSFVTRDSSLHHLIQGIRAEFYNRIFWIEKDCEQMGWLVRGKGESWLGDSG